MLTFVKAKIIASWGKYRDLMPSEENVVHVKEKQKTLGAAGMVTKLKITPLYFAKIK